jgi:bacterioferritin-associated ferredoxin
MIVCVCRNVSDRAVAGAVEGGARDLEGVAQVTGAGTACGCCHEAIEGMLAVAGPCSSPPCAGCPRAAEQQSRVA